MVPLISDHQWLIQAALAEDIGRGDLTCEAIVAVQQKIQVQIVAREAMVACGLSLAAQVFFSLNDTVGCAAEVSEGQHVEAGAVLLEVSGPARVVLAAERTALNLLSHMCGVATLTHRYVQALEGTGAVLLDTRKTLPGYRELDKYAVRIGGGQNHRMRLDDGVLIKDNHIAICGGVAAAVQQAKASVPMLTKVEVECDTLDQVREAVDAGADMILLDNMNTDQLREAVSIAGGRVPLEASGNVSLETIRSIAETGVNYISVGRITHSAPAADVGLDIKGA